MIGTYKKKAEVVQAVQWTDETQKDVLSLIGSGQDGKVPVTTLSERRGVRFTAKGDYFIKGADGKITSCDAPTFTVLYERAESPKPDFTKPIDLLAYFYEELGACGCSDLEAMITVVRSLLAWIDDKSKPGFESLSLAARGCTTYSSVGLIPWACAIMGSLFVFPFLPSREGHCSTH